MKKKIRREFILVALFTITLTTLLVTAVFYEFFKKEVITHRCLIPASGFYEWDGHKHKFTFENEKRSLLLMTGIYRNVNGQTEVTIVTTKANKSMCEIHDRMPLILEEHLNHDWLENRHIEALLRTVPQSLTITSGFLQSSLF